MTGRTSPAERRERRAAVEDPAVVLGAAAAFLAVRPRSVAETRRRLSSLGYRAHLVDHVVDRLAAYGYLDDEAFGRAWLESRDRARPRGSYVLRHELLTKGLPPELVATLLAERDAGGDPQPAGEAQPAADVAQAAAAEPAADPDLAAAARLLARRRAALQRERDPRRRRARAYALLARSGFDPDVIREVLAAFLAADPAVGDADPFGAS